MGSLLEIDLLKLINRFLVSRIQASEMKLLRPVNGCTKLDTGIEIKISEEQDI